MATHRGAPETVREGASGKARGLRRRSPNVAQAVLLGSAASQLCLALLTTIYLARALSPSAFGFFSLVGTVFILSRKFLDLGLGNVAARDIAREPQRERPILEGLMAYRRAAGVLLAAGLSIFAVLQNTGAERFILLGVALMMLCNGPAALDPVFQVRQAQLGPAILNLAGGLLVLAGSVVFTHAGVAGEAFGWWLVLREALLLFFTWLLAQHLLGYRPHPGFRGRALKAFVRPAIVFGLASLIYTVYFHGDVFFVYALRGKEELGAYAAAFRPVNPLLFLPWLLMLPLIPVLSVTAVRDRSTFVRQVRGACAVALGIGACGMVAGVQVAPDLVRLLYKGHYLVGPLSCVQAFRWLAVALAEVCVTTVLTGSLLAIGKEKLLLWIGMTALLVNATANLVLLRTMNFTAAAITTAATEALYLALALIAFRAVAGCAALGWRQLAYLAPALAMSLLLPLARRGAVIHVAAGIVLGAICVVILLATPRARRLRRDLSESSSRLIMLGDEMAEV